jgi:hypothetical protein
VCTSVNSAEPPDAGNPHVRWDEGAPVGLLHRPGPTLHMLFGTWISPDFTAWI